MRKIRKVMLFIIVFIIAVSIKENTAFAEYVIQVVPNSTRWTSITASNAYDECQKLNTTSSTLGTTSLKAHLTTNADWYAVSLLTYSTYGSKNASNTTGNNTGIMNLGISYTAALMEGAVTNNNWKSLYDNINTPYVESVKNSTNKELNEPGRGLLSSERLISSGIVSYSNNTGAPVVNRNALFGIGIGTPLSNGTGYSGEGAVTTGVSFRPVIWNK